MNNLKRAAEVLLLATFDTKASEAEYLAERIRSHGLVCDLLDVSLTTSRDSKIRLTGQAKLDQMARVSSKAGAEIRRRVASGTRVVAGLGGGTGTRIVADACSALHFAIPKVLVTTMAADPRPFTADNSIVLIPSVCDISGLGPHIRQVLENAASVVAGLASQRHQPRENNSALTVGLTALGATELGAEATRKLLGAQGFEVTVFHANGYGGSALRRLEMSGAFDGLIDLTIHEAVWFLFNVRSLVPPDRFRTSSALPRIILPGGANFRTEGPVSSLGNADRKRQHYSHSPDFTHVALTSDEMATVGRFMAGEINSGAGPTEVLLPMGGFSSEDRDGGAIECPEGRNAFANALVEELDDQFPLRKIEGHINDEATAVAAARALAELLARSGTHREHPGEGENG